MNKNEELILNNEIERLENANLNNRIVQGKLLALKWFRDEAIKRRL